MYINFQALIRKKEMYAKLNKRVPCELQRQRGNQRNKGCRACQERGRAHHTDSR